VKWLVDHNVPQGVFRILNDFGIDAVTAEFMGLEELTNGALVRKAAHLGIECILTQDTTFASDASKAIRDNPGICVVVIDTTTLPQAPGGMVYH
jgi:predicted nuclease of predicted toxin-antitoxin system